MSEKFSPPNPSEVFETIIAQTKAANRRFWIMSALWVLAIVAIGITFSYSVNKVNKRMESLRGSLQIFMNSHYLSLSETLKDQLVTELIETVILQRENGKAVSESFSSLLKNLLEIESKETRANRYYLLRAAIEASENKIEEATTRLQQALIVDPNYAGTLLLHKRILYERNDPEDYSLSDIQDCNQILFSYPENEFAYNYRGWIQLQLGNYANAIKDFGKAYRLNRNYQAVEDNLQKMKKLLEEKIEKLEGQVYSEARRELLNAERAMKQVEILLDRITTSK